VGSRDDNLQWTLHALLAAIIAVVFVVAMGELRLWYLGLIFGVILGFPASGAIVWFWVDVLKRPLRDGQPQVQRVRREEDDEGGPENAQAARLHKAADYVVSCGELTFAQALKALRMAGRMDLKQTLLNTWATHKPNEVREFLRDQFEADARAISSGTRSTQG
jgi:hypothetical protein